MSDLTDFFEEDAFCAFSGEHGEDIDETIYAMYQQWKRCQDNNIEIDYFDLPQAVLFEEPTEDFEVEVIEKVDGAGFISVFNTESENMKEMFVWRVKCDGTIQIVLKAKQEADPLDKATHSACVDLIVQHYEGRKLEVEPKMRDHLFRMYSGIDDEKEKEED